MKLSRRQKSLLLGVAVGESIAETAARMGIAPRTVKHHRHQLFEKLGVKSQEHLQSRIIMRLLTLLDLES